MKKALLLALIMALILGACAKNLQKLSPQGNLNLKSANVYYAQKSNPASLDKALKLYEEVLKDNPEHVLALKRSADLILNNALPLDTEKKAVGDSVYFVKMENAKRAIGMYKITYAKYSEVLRVLGTYPELTDDQKSIKRDSQRKKESSWVHMFNIAKVQFEQQLTLENKDFTSARDNFEMIYKLDENRQEPLRSLVAIYQEMKDDAKFDEYLNKVLAVSPDDVEMIKLKGAFLYNKGSDLYSKGTELFNKGTDLKNNNDSDGAKKFFDEAQENFDGANEYFDGAKEYFKIVMAARPLDTNNMLLLYECYLNIKDYPAALEIINKVLRLEPDSKEALVSAKNLAIAMENTVLEIDYWKRILVVDPSLANLSKITGRLLKLEMYSDALTYAEKWYNLDNSSVLAAQSCHFAAQRLNRPDIIMKYADILKRFP
jgi:tetratricopeptide (TPR) repeat protein